MGEGFMKEEVGNDSLEEKEEKDNLDQTSVPHQILNGPSSLRERWPANTWGGSYVGSGGDESRSEVMWPHLAVQILSFVTLKIGERECVCICVHMWVYVWMSAYEFMRGYVCENVCVFECMCLHVCICKCVCMRMCAYLSVCVHVWECMNIWVHVFACIRICVWENVYIAECMCIAYVSMYAYVYVWECIHVWVYVFCMCAYLSVYVCMYKIVCICECLYIWEYMYMWWHMCMCENVNICECMYVWES